MVTTALGVRLRHASTRVAIPSGRHVVAVCQGGQVRHVGKFSHVDHRGTECAVVFVFVRAIRTTFLPAVVDPDVGITNVHKRLEFPVDFATSVIKSVYVAFHDGLRVCGVVIGME